MTSIKNLSLIAAFILGGITACNYTVGECYPRGQGSESAGAGGGSVIIPGGVGGYGDEPPKRPLDSTNPPTPCNSGDDPEFGKPADQYINCRARGLDASACSDACLNAGASCVPFALHPYKSGMEPGKLTYCKNGWPTTTCTYTFANTDACTLVTIFGSGLKWVCMYAGG